MTQNLPHVSLSPRTGPVGEIRARFHIGQLVRHAAAGFVAVIMDVDPEYAGLAEDTGDFQRHQPFYRLLVEGSDGQVLIYAPEEALSCHQTGGELNPRDRELLFFSDAAGHLAPLGQSIH